LTRPFRPRVYIAWSEDCEEEWSDPATETHKKGKVDLDIKTHKKDKADPAIETYKNDKVKQGGYYIGNP
jgi:hypothetical protein